MNNLGKFPKLLGNLGKVKNKVSESKNSQNSLGMLSNPSKNTLGNLGNNEEGCRRRVRRGFNSERNPRRKDKE